LLKHWNLFLNSLEEPHKIFVVLMIHHDMFTDSGSIQFIDELVAVLLK